MSNTLVVEDSANASLDYYQSAFTRPSYDARVSDFTYERYYPVNGIRDCSSIRFSIPAKKGGIVMDITMKVLLDLCDSISYLVVSLVLL